MSAGERERAVEAALIGLAALIKAATSPNPPGWRLYVTRPGEESMPRGPFSDSLVSCMLDLHSDAIVQPKGTRLVCLRVGADGMVRR